MIAIISDIHGNYPAIKAALEEIDHLGCETIFSLGDVAGYYCMINECIELLQQRNIFHLRGNHDYYLSSNRTCPRSNSASRCLEFQQRVIKNSNLEWLQELENTLLIDDISMIHGGWRHDPLEEYLYEIRADYFDNLEGTVFFSGHTHVPCLYEFNEKTYCNPGSIGQPRDGDPRASFAVMDVDKISLRRVKYDIDEIAFEMKKCGFDPYFYENLYKGIRIGGELSTCTLSINTAGS